MTRKEEVDRLYDLGVTKRKGWLHHDCPILAADYGDVEKAWTTITSKVSEEDRKELVHKIELAARAQAIFRKHSRAAGEKVPQPKLLASWLRKKRWLDQIESHSELEQKVKATKCPCCGADGVIKIAGKSYCERYYRNNLMAANDRRRLKDSMKEHHLIKGENESSKDFQKRCADSYKKAMGRFCGRT